MMSKELLKKAGVVGIAFGLLASPMAFAQTTEHPSIEENQDSMVEQDETQDHGVNMNTNESPDYTQEELTTDHHTQGPNDETIGEPDSTGTAPDSIGDTDEGAEMSPEEVVEKNSES
ncbi:hypothetical protein RN347_00290 [Halomonas sp. PAMB 3264]|uniref:hypothetical protein n=2 Tax=unclassified Halomonas TaxID=2609666 RepID=UPI002899D72C|nr:hypothetical protein [Halomonas sp. PAMB 3264]WNL42369.1 hypothetical protein RN347_00290 [Halomonas sp. PAMB 3264]